MGWLRRHNDLLSSLTTIIAVGIVGSLWTVVPEDLYVRCRQSAERLGAVIHRLLENR